MRFTRQHYILTLIFLSALVIRLLFVLQSNNVPSADAHVYDRVGLSLSQGKGYVNSDGSPHSFYPPFYPLFLSAIYAIFGHSYLAVRIIQSVLGAFSCVLIYLIGKKAYSETVGLSASFLSIIYFPFIKSAELLLTELVFTFLLSLVVYHLFKVQEGAHLKNYLILGLLMGLALLTKTVMLFFPLFIIPIFFKRGCLLSNFKKYVLVLLFFGLSTLPWILRNYNVYHEFMPTSTASGLGFYSSYRPANGIFGVLASPDDPVMREAVKFSSPVLESNFLVKKTLEFIINNPDKVFILELKKILYFWVPLDWEIVGGRWFNFMYVIMLPFFAVGLLFSFKEFRKFYPILLPILYFQIMALIFYGSPRFRLPVEPYIFILSIIGIMECLKRMDRWSIGKYLK